MATNYVTLVNQGNSVTVGPPPVTGTIFERRGSEWLVLAENIGLVASPRVDNAIVIADLASTAMSYSLGLQDAVTAADVISGIGFGREVFAADAITVSDVAGSNPSVRLSDAVAASDSAAAEIDTGWEDSTKSLEFASSGSQYTQASSLAYALDEAVSISMWFKFPNPLPTGYYVLWSSGDSSSYWVRHIFYFEKSASGSVILYMQEAEGGGGTSRMFSNKDLKTPADPSLYINPQLGEWQHIAFTSSSTSSAAGTFKAYLNGAELGSWTGKQLTGSALQTTPTIASTAYGSSYFEGGIDQVAIYQRVLSASDVTALYGTSRKPQTPYLSSGNPIHLWAMGENVTGSTMPDQVGSVDMTLYNSPTVSTDVAPAAWSNRWSTKFDGTDDYLKSTSSPIDVTGAFSVSLWAKVGTPQAGGTEVIFMLTGSSTYKPRLQIYKQRSGSGASEKVRFLAATTDGAGGASSIRAFNTGTGTAEIEKWRHVAVTCTATSSAAGVFTLYVDGTASSDQTMDQLDAAADINEVLVGAWRHTTNGGITKFFDGNVDEISCWNRVLSASEITALYNSGIPTDPMNTTGVTADAVAYYRMGDRWDQGTVPDQIGSVDLTMSSAPVPEEDVPSWAKSTRSVSHDGVDDYTYGALPRSVIESAFSISIWVKYLSGQGAASLFALNQGNASGGAYTGWGFGAMFIDFFNSGNTRAYSRGPTGNSDTGGTLPNLGDGNWHHIVYTASHTASADGTATVYIDGSSAATMTSHHPYESSDTAYEAGASLWVATKPTGPTTTTYHSNSKADEITIWTSAISASDVTALYNSGVPADPSTVGSGPAYYWRMGEDVSSTTIPDHVGSNDLTLINGAEVVNDVPGYSPAYIPQTILWVDASDSSTVTVASPFSTTITQVTDKGHENTNWSGAGTLSEQDWVADTSGLNEIFHDTISGVGNGNKFFRGNSSAGRGYCVLTPSASPYNLTSGAGSAAIESDWLLWQVCYVVHVTPGSLDAMSVFARGGAILQSGFVGGHSPAAFSEVEDARFNTYQFGDWTSGGTSFTRWASGDTPAYTNPSGDLTLFCLQSYDDGGTRKFRYTKDGSTWFEKTITATNGTSISAAANKLEFCYTEYSSDQIVGIGEAGFCGGVVSDADIAQLYTYAEDKWDLS